MLLQSDKVCIERRSEWMDEGTKHQTLTQENAAHVQLTINTVTCTFLMSTVVV